MSLEALKKQQGTWKTPQKRKGDSDEMGVRRHQNKGFAWSILKTWEFINIEMKVPSDCEQVSCNICLVLLSSLLRPEIWGREQGKHRESFLFLRKWVAAQESSVSNSKPILLSCHETITGHKRGRLATYGQRHGHSADARDSCLVGTARLSSLVRSMLL